MSIDIQSHQRPMLRFLTVLTAASTVGFQSYAILFNNFAIETVGLDGLGVGVIQSVREIPGFLALFAVIVMRVMKEHRLSAASIALAGLGTMLTGMLPTYAGLALSTLVLSFGYHYYETTNQSLILQYFHTRTAPLVFGRLRSLAAFSSIGAGALIWLLGLFLEYRGIYWVIGALVFLAGAWGLVQEPTHASVAPQHQRMILKKKYWLFYLLTLLSGARRQVFIVFSMFLLVKMFHFTIHEMTALFVINNVIGYVMNPLIGRAIVRFGERKISSIEYLGVILIFVTYAVTDSKWLVSLMYILDSLLFNFSVAIRTYFQKIGEPGDVASSMAVGFTINHIAAVFLPALGGYFWMLNYRIPFVAGAVLGGVSLIAAQWMNPDENRKARTP